MTETGFYTESPVFENPKIYSAIASIMSEVGAIGKEKRNAQQGFMYRGIDDVMNVLHPLFARHRVFLVPECLDITRDERTNRNGTMLTYTIAKVKYTLYAEDGSSVSAVVFGEGMDSGDKGTNKAMAIAMKYALFQIFCIPTEEMIDPDGEAHKDILPKGQKPAKIIPPSTPPASVSPNPTLAEQVDMAIKKVIDPLTTEERKPHIDKIKKICGVVNYRKITDETVLANLLKAFTPGGEQAA